MALDQTMAVPAAAVLAVLELEPALVLLLELIIQLPLVLAEALAQMEMTLYSVPSHQPLEAEVVAPQIARLEIMAVPVAAVV